MDKEVKKKFKELWRKKKEKNNCKLVQGSISNCSQVIQRCIDKCARTSFITFQFATLVKDASEQFHPNVVVTLLVHQLGYKGVNQWFFCGTILQLGEFFFKKLRKTRKNMISR